MAEGYKVLKTPVSYISIDVNPSLELELNCFARVITAQAYNEEAKSILEEISVRGEKYTEAIEIIMESEEMSGYLTGLIKLSVKEVTIPENAPPIMTPTAISITFPRSANALNRCGKCERGA